MSLARDSAVLFASEGASALLTIITGFLIARWLPVDDFGRFTAAVAFAGILAVVADSGMGLLAAKEMAAGDDPSSGRLSEILTSRLLMVVVVCVIGPFLALVALPGGESRRVGAWLTPGLMLVALADFFAWILKGRRRVNEAAVVQVGTQGVLSLLCIAALLFGRSLLSLLAAFWVAGAVVLAGGPLVLRQAGIHLRLVPLTKDLFLRTGPNVTKIGAVIILSVAFTRVDLLLVSGILGATAAGYFGASGRMVDALQIVPTVANGTLLPRFSALRDEPAAFGAQLRRAFVVLLALSVIAAAFCAIFAAPLLSRLLGGSYEKAAPVLRPLAWSCIPMFLNMLGFSALYALHDHRTLITGIGVALALELALDMLWLPRYGVVAAGWSRLTAEVVNTIIVAAGLARRRLR